MGIAVRDSKGRPVDAEGDAVMLETIEQGIDQGLALEQLVPVRIIQIGCDNRRAPGITQIHEFEKGVDLFGLQGQITEFIDLQDIVAGEAVEQPGGGAVGQ